MKRKPIDANSAGVPVVLGIIKAAPGIEVRQIACKAELSLSHVKNVLGVISGIGAAFPVPDGHRRGWYEAELAKPLLEQWGRTRRKRDKAGPKPQTKRDKIHTLSQAPEGVSMAQIMEAFGIGMNVGGKHCTAMVRQGRIFRAERAGCRLRWFDSAARAQAWSQMPPMTPSEWSGPCARSWETSRAAQNAARAEKLKRQAEARMKAQQAAADKARMAIQAKAKRVNVEKFKISKAAKGLPAPVSLKRQELSAAVDYSRAKVIVCPSPGYDARYQLPPGAIVEGDFTQQWRQLRSAA